MAWEVKLFKRTRLAEFKNCLTLIEAYADLAPLWERLLLTTFAGLGPPLGRWFGGNTSTLWRQAEAIVGDVFATSRMSPHEVASTLRQYIKVKRTEDHGLSFEKARETIYEQSFYPLVTHFTLAFQPSAAARLRFVRRVVEDIASRETVVADLGCGSGAVLCEVLKARPTWTGYGLDISEAAIGYARRLARHKGVCERAEFQTGSLESLPYASHSLDVVIASEVVEHLPEPGRVFNELARVLAPGGYLLVTMPVESRTPAHMHALNNAEELEALCKLAGLRVSSIQAKWHVSYGDDRKHVFAVARPTRDRDPVEQPVYSLPLPQISAAASSGMVSS